EALGDHEIFVPFLSYPYACGCKDPDYLEASPDYACEDNSLCKTLIVLGCTDSMACNYNPDANFNVADLCCYIGFCHDLDISVVCPDLQPRIDGFDAHVKVYPNPVIDELRFDLGIVQHNDIIYSIHDVYGRIVHKGVIQDQVFMIDVSSLVTGMHALQLQVAGYDIAPVPFIKM
ncbi:MAG TPA: T9SS type A sorting domain-containing protein, partial [Saprospiraceae bacterium]|nr:T9SS type A sorting domain-containing protein [Saprospiraceae bacterium]